MILPYQSSDIAKIALTPKHRALADAAPGALEDLGRRGLAVTSWAAAGVVAIMGALPQGDNLCEVFIFPSTTLARANAKTLFGDVAKALEWAREKFPVVRSITRRPSRGGAPEAWRFLRHLGFDVDKTRTKKADVFITWVFLR